MLEDDTLLMLVAVGVYVPEIRLPLLNVCVPENVIAARLAPLCPKAIASPVVVPAANPVILFPPNGMFAVIGV